LPPFDVQELRQVEQKAATKEPLFGSLLTPEQNRLAFCLGDLGFVSPPTGEALATCSLNDLSSALGVLDSQVALNSQI